MRVASENQISPRIVQSLPRRRSEAIERVDDRIVSRGEKSRVVHQPQNAGLGVRRQVRDEPVVLRASRLGAHLGAIGVEDHDMPRPDVVRVVHPGRVGYRGAEVAVVTLRGRGAIVLVIADDRLGDRLERAPGRVVAVGEVAGPGVGVNQISQRGNDRIRVARQQTPYQVSRSVVLGPAAVGDVTRCQDHGRGIERHRQTRSFVAASARRGRTQVVL